MQRQPTVEDAITVDEIGIRTGRYGRYHLKSAYQPVYRREDDRLVPFAVEALITPFVAGRPVQPRRLFARTPSKDRMFVENVCRALHLANYQNIGVPGLQLFFNFDPGVNSDVSASVGQIRAMARRLDALSLSGRLLVCEITEAAALDPGVLARLTREMRRHGIRIAIDDFGRGESNLERVELIAPDIVKIDGSWFRNLTRITETVQLLNSLVEGFKDRGVRVLVEGIESALQLRIAHEAGVDYYQGYLLGRPAMAGTIFNEAPLNVKDLTDLPQNVVFLKR